MVLNTTWAGAGATTTVAVVAGTPAASPVAPSLIKNPGVQYQTSLVRVLVRPGVTQLLDSDLLDERPIRSANDVTGNLRVTGNVNAGGNLAGTALDLDAGKTFYGVDGSMAASGTTSSTSRITVTHTLGRVPFHAHAVANGSSRRFNLNAHTATNITFDVIDAAGGAVGAGIDIGFTWFAIG